MVSLTFRRNSPTFKPSRHQLQILIESPCMQAASLCGSFMGPALGGVLADMSGLR